MLTVSVGFHLNFILIAYYGTHSLQEMARTGWSGNAQATGSRAGARGCGRRLRIKQEFCWDRWLRDEETPK